MPQTARYSLTIPALSHDDANALATRIEEHLQLDAMAVIINETDEAKAYWETIAYFATEGEASNAAGLLGFADAAVTALIEQDWVRQSLEGLSPVTAGRFFLHGSHDRRRRRAGGIALEIDAGTAFGTGHHGTTEGCLIALDRILKVRRPRRLLDVGCGTGVLAIAAARATLRPTLASDIDPEAVRVTKANAAHNGASALVRCFTAAGLKHASIASAGPYDLIFANILARPLVALAQSLAQILVPGGDLILSGITRDQARWILATYRNRGLVPVAVIMKGNWVTLRLSTPTKKKRPRGRNPGRFLASTKGAGRETA